MMSEHKSAHGLAQKHKQLQAAYFNNQRKLTECAAEKKAVNARTRDLIQQKEAKVAEEAKLVQEINKNRAPQIGPQWTILDRMIDGCTKFVKIWKGSLHLNSPGRRELHAVQDVRLGAHMRPLRE